MASASSSFVGTESPLSEGGVWALPSAFWGSMSKATGAKVTTVSTESGMYYNGVTFSPDQFSQITIASIPTGGQLYFQYVNCRMNTTAGTYQVATSSETGPNILQLYQISNIGTFNQIGTDITTGSNIAAGNIVRLEVVGTTLTVKIDQGSGFVTLRTTTDSTYTTGQPGIGGWALDAPSNVAFISSWSAGDIVSTSFTARPRTPNYLFSL